MASSRTGDTCPNSHISWGWVFPGRSGLGVSELKKIGFAWIQGNPNPAKFGLVWITAIWTIPGLEVLNSFGAIWELWNDLGSALPAHGLAPTHLPPVAYLTPPMACLPPPAAHLPPPACLPPSCSSPTPPTHFPPVAHFPHLPTSHLQPASQPTSCPQLSSPAHFPPMAHLPCPPPSRGLPISHLPATAQPLPWLVSPQLTLPRLNPP